MSTLFHVPAERIRSVLCSAGSVLLMIGSFLQSGAACSADDAVLEREKARVETIARITPSVVCVMSPDGQGGGSGVLISADGLAISNYHVTSACGSFMKCGLSDGRIYDAVIVGIDPTGDLAMIQLLGRTDFLAATQGNSDQVQVGDEVMALGNPFLLASDFTPTVTFGIVSGVHRYQYPANSFLEYTDCIQIDASINPGNSGGPLFDSAGRWIGINGRASFEKRGRVNSGAAYAISLNQVQMFLEHLKCGLIVDHGVADFTVRTAADGRVDIDEVSEVSEAWRRGLRPGQELLSFAGRVITSANDFQNVLGIYPEGSRVALSWRDVDQVRTATIRLRPLHAFQKAPELPAERKPPRPPNPEDDSDPAPEMPMPEVSPELLKLFEEREGYANFRYNALRQNELLLPLKEAMKATPDVSGTWVLKVKGEIKNTVADSADSSVVVKPVSGEIVIGDTASSLTLGSDQWYQSADDVQAQNEPPEFRGLLAALLHLKSFLTRQGVGFDDVSATAHIGSGGLSSLTPGLIIRDGGKTGRWHFDRKSPFPSALDYEYAQGSDEARITFDSWNLKNGIPLPDRIGWTSPETEVVVWLQVENVSRTVAEEKTEADPQPVVPPAQGASEKQTFIDHQRGQQPAGILRTLFEIRNQLRPERMLMSQIVTEPQETSAAAGSDVSSMIQARQSVVVKLFGAGVGNLDSYGSGVLISAEGHVLTVWNHLINVGFLTAVTSDGRRFSVEVVGTNREHDVAVLKLRSDDDRPFSWLDLKSAVSAEPGDPVMAFSNMFHVATGNEPVSVVHGVVAARTTLSAGQGRWSFPLKKPVLIVDAVTNNSGAAGGLLTLADGSPVGLIGRELRHEVSNTWVNYAVPLTLLADVAEAIISGKPLVDEVSSPKDAPMLSDRQITKRFGLTLLPNIVEKTPAFIDAVTSGGLADEAGLRRGDLIVLVDGDVITCVTDLQQQLAARRSGQPISFTITRDQQLIVIQLRVP